MPIFEHTTRVPAPRPEVFAWHTRPGAFVRLTPPGLATELSGPREGISAGSESTLRVSSPLLAGLLPRLGRGPVGVDWRLRITHFDPGTGFIDVQLSGPFTRWAHEHRFAEAPDGSTVITDHVEWDLPVAAAARGLVERELRRLFEFRERQLLADLSLHNRLGAKPRTFLISGASGLIGTQLTALLGSGGHRVLRLVRSGPPTPGTIAWNPAERRLPAGALDGVDVVINLSGHSIGERFTHANKQAILDSRLDATATLAAALADDAADTDRALIQASAVGYYGPRRPRELLTEGSARGEGFLADVVDAWERAAAPARAAGVRTAFLRTGIVLSAGGGALLPQLPLFLIGAGGRLTARDAWLSWIGLDDLARAYAFAALTPSIVGPVNAVAPHPVTQQDFAATLGRVLHRPAKVPTPSIGPRLVLGSEGYDQLIDTDQRVAPQALTAAGARFEFAQPLLTDALRHALQR